MTTLPVSSRVPDELAAQYRAEGWWDDRRLADGLEAAGRSKPDALAVADNEHELTYAELVERVNGAIAELIERDVGTNTGVVLVTGNTVDAVVAYHALLRVGATVVATRPSVRRVRRPPRARDARRRGARRPSVIRTRSSRRRDR